MIDKPYELCCPDDGETCFHPMIANEYADDT